MPEDEQLSVTQKYGVIPQRLFMEQEDQKVVLALSGLGNFKRVQPDDFVISLRSFQGGIERSRYAGCVSPAYTVLRPNSELVPSFWEYLLKSSKYIAALQTTTDGIRDGKNISYEQFGALCIPIAPPNEQTTIAAFLDRETSKIDALIAEQEKLIALLAEKRQATISHAVTRGLNPDVPMKDSEVDWLGEVPAHWGVVQLRRVLEGFEQGWSPECEARQVEDDEWGVLKAGCVNGGVFQANEHKALPSALEPRANFEVQDGDVLMSRASGSPKLIGSVALLVDPPPRLMLSDKIFRLSLSQEMLSSYFALMMSSRPLRIQIEQSIGGAEGLANNLTQASIKEFWLTLPPLDEQKAIASYLGSVVKKYEGLIQEVACGIGLLKERRSALIAAAVTGQIDVRGLVDATPAT
ncbi:restriction endonuclease subunit S [Alcaligenes faecalis]|uniref:restriction endonuclease subunit S n=1 Tax=Alcaligenes faecalis TaxID=511 RepID=UPI001C834CA2|nr:restriction endonuclease subunit S [Alcaligenes faecalis]